MLLRSRRSTCGATLELSTLCGSSLGRIFSRYYPTIGRLGNCGLTRRNWAKGVQLLASQEEYGFNRKDIILLPSTVFNVNRGGLGLGSERMRVDIWIVFVSVFLRKPEFTLMMTLIVMSLFQLDGDI